MKLKSKIISGIFMAIGIVIIHNCSIWYYNSLFYIKNQSESEEYGIKYNEERVKLGIPIIEDSWYTFDLTYRKLGARKFSPKNYWRSQLWSDFKVRDYPYHKEKEIFRSNYELDFEVDRFVNRASKSNSYVLELTYSYKERSKMALLTFND